MDVISVFEHATLTVGNNLSADNFESLKRFHQRQGKTYYSLVHNGIKFNQYVGLLRVGNLSLEVLPKVDNHPNTDALFWRDKLIFMLSKVHRLDLKMPTQSQQEPHKNTVLDVFICRFLTEVEVLLRKGLLKCYHNVQGNRNSLKGHLVFSKHIVHNISHAERFFVDYSTYDREHLFNRIIRMALAICPKLTGNNQIINRAYSLLFEFPEVAELNISKEIFNNMSFDRKSEDYKCSIKLAKILLLNYIPDIKTGHEENFSLMFDMNKLWEEFVLEVLRSGMPEFQIRGQETKTLWHSSLQQIKHARPDIVIRKEGRVVCVLDTKWKCPGTTPGDGDLHQMFVYHHLFGTNNTAFLYPGNNKDIQGVFSTSDQCRCDMMFIPLVDEDREWINTIPRQIETWINLNSYSHL